MATVKYNITFIPRAGAFGTQISYRKESETVWTIPQVPANPTTLASYPVELQENTTYYISVSSIGKNCKEKKYIQKVVTPKLTPCCPDSYTLSPDQSYCFLEETMAPEIESQNICVAPSRRSPEYSGNGTRLFKTIGSYSTILVGEHTLLKTPYWNGDPEGSDSNIGGNIISPMNALGIWIDSDCDGQKDGLTKNSILQFTIQLIVPTAKQVFIGIAGDNTFKVTLNGNIIVECQGGSGSAGGESQPSYNFVFWWVFPVQLISGTNLVNFQYVGDGSIVDAAGFAIYDNTPAELENATRDEDLKFLFRSSDMIGTRIDIAKCLPGWTLDTSGGSGNYVCRRVTNSPTIPCP